MKKKWQILILIGMGILAYGPTLKVGFLWDDHVIIENNPYVQSISWTNIRHAFTSDIFNGVADRYYRPFITLSNMFDFSLWGHRPFGFHLTNLFILILNGVLIFFLFEKIFHPRNIAFYAALLFLVHPLIVEQTLVICGRTETMALTFTLGSLLLGLRRKRGALVGSGLLFLMACMCKETGLVTPAFLLLIGWYKEEYKLPWAWYLYFCFLGTIYLIFRAHAVTNAEILPNLGYVPIFVMRDFPMICVEYLRILQFPFDLHSHRRMEFNWTWLLLSYTTLILILLLWIRTRSKILAFGVCWFFLGLMPKIPILINNALMLDHWAYPSNMAAMLLVALLLVQISNLFLRRMVLVITLILYTAVTWVNIVGRNTDKKLYEWAVDYRTSSTVKANLANIYYMEGRYAEAEQLFLEAHQLRPNDEFIRKGLIRVKEKRVADRDSR